MNHWMTWLSQQPVTTFLDSIGTYLAIGTFGFSAFVAFNLHRQNKRIRHAIAQSQPLGNYASAFDQWKHAKTENPYVLAISLISNQNSIKQDVQKFLEVSNIQHKGILEITQNGIEHQKHDTAQFLERLRKARLELSEKGCTDLRVFYQGPAILAVQIGAIFDNWIPVRLYHKSSPATPKVYEYWGVLSK